MVFWCQVEKKIESLPHFWCVFFGDKKVRLQLGWLRYVRTCTVDSSPGSQTTLTSTSVLPSVLTSTCASLWSRSHVIHATATSCLRWRCSETKMSWARSIYTCCSPVEKWRHFAPGLELGRNGRNQAIWFTGQSVRRQWNTRTEAQKDIFGISTLHALRHLQSLSRNFTSRLLCIRQGCSARQPQESSPTESHSTSKAAHAN